MQCNNAILSNPVAGLVVTQAGRMNAKEFDPVVRDITAFLAYKQEAAKGRRGDPDGRVVAMQVSGAPCLTQSKEFELLANTMSALSIEVAENNRLLRAQAERGQVARAADFGVEQGDGAAQADVAGTGL